MHKRNAPEKIPPDLNEYIVEIPLPRLLRFLGRSCRESLRDILQREYGYLPTGLDSSLIVRYGLGRPLHLNLGIDGVDSPRCPIEENSAALYAALAGNARSVPTLLSGELERAVRLRLISRKALINLRKKIRATV